jgi:hypothetical protein
VPGGADGRDGVARAKSERPDLVLMEVTKPYSPIQLLRIIGGFLNDEVIE